jgi:WD40 repeat protein
MSGKRSGLLLAIVLIATTCHRAASQVPPVQDRNIPPGDKPPRTDLYGDPLPAGALARLGTVRFREGNYIGCAALSPDGKILALASQRESVRLLEAATGKELRQFKAADRIGITTLTFAPDGRTLALSGYSGNIFLLDVATGQELRRFQGQRSYRAPLVFSADGKVLAMGAEGHGTKDKVQAWDVATGKSLGQFEVLQNYDIRVALSPDGKTLASWGRYLGRGPGQEDQERNQTIQRWEIATGKELPRLKTLAGEVRCAVYSPDGKAFAATSGNGRIQRWEAATGKELPGLAGQSNQRVFLAFSPDSRMLVSASYDGKIQRWEVATGKSLDEFQGPKNRVISVVFPADGKVLAWAIEGQAICLWDVLTGKALNPKGGHQQGIQTVAFAGNGQVVVSTGMDGKICLWELATGKEINQIDVRDEFSARMPRTLNESAVALSPDGRYLATTQRNGPAVTLWDAATGTELRRFARPAGYITSPLVFSPDSRTLAAGTATQGGLRGEEMHSTVQLWEVGSGTVRSGFTGHLGMVSALAFSAEGKILATGSTDTTVLLWDVTGQLLRHQPRPASLSAKELDRLWLDLADPDATHAYQAIWTLAAAPKDAVPFLQKHLQPITGKAVAAEEIDQLIAQLDDDSFPVREKAARNLEQLGQAAEPALRKVLQGSPSAEVRRRAEQLVDKLKATGPALALLRPLRALEVLEHTPTAEARQVLAALAKGKPDAQLTQEAKAALRRLARQLAVP